MKDKELRELFYKLVIYLDKKERKNPKSFGIDIDGIMNSGSFMNRVHKLKKSKE